ncbi:MAG TPA: 2-C-methyl-D-erythritol 2,4-cyclodiphosphate synthase [Halanaerobiales bacterium]|nr:2-C-methyl-D-erythritol 2,4-cyclodiphosphate synthase [Halanaerobiales bacterium]
MRVGIGYDIHRLEKGHDLTLGGVKIPHDKGLMGHSDADVLIHALIDALLGAASLGDIGRHFPDNDSKYKDISSIILLEKTVDLLKNKNYNINNIDLIIIAEKPKIMPYNTKIVSKLIETLRIEKNMINLKATTAEGLGFVGKKKGIAAKAIVSIIKDENKE